MNRVREAGFTLIELIVTISIMGILIIGLVNLYITVETGQRKSYNIEMATRAGERKIESLRNAQYASLVPDTEVDFTAELPEDLPSPNSGNIQITEPVAGI